MNPPPPYPPSGYQAYPPSQQDQHARPGSQYAPPAGPPPGAVPDYERGASSLAIGAGAAMLAGQMAGSGGPQGYASPPTQVPGPGAGSGLGRSNSREDPLTVLKRFDTVILVDDSASMQEGGRWQETEAALQGVVNKVVMYDADGIDVYFLNSSKYLQNVRSPQDVGSVFSQVKPVGASTPTEVRVEELLGMYLDRLEQNKAQGLPPLKPLNLIVLTDGQADDPDTLAYALSNFCVRLDEGRFPLTQLGVQFVQVGNDPEATRALKELDDELKGNRGVGRDIVDTTPYQGRMDGDFIIKVLLGGVNRRIDRN